METRTVETITCGRIYETLHPGLSGQSGPDESSVRAIATQVGVAALLDDADDADIQIRGARGAASAHAQIGFGSPDNGDFERCESMDHPAVRALPIGDPAAARRAIRRRRAEGQSWDGHNHVDRPVRHLEQLLAEMRAV